MEVLFKALKEVAAGQTPSQYDEVEALIGDMKRLSDPALLHHSCDLKAAIKQRRLGGQGCAGSSNDSAGRRGATRTNQWL